MTQYVTNYTDNRDLSGRNTIAGLFHDRASAEQAIRELRNAGFPAEAIGVALRDRTAQDELVADTGAGSATAAGLVGGGLLGGLVGYLVGIGALLIPGVGPIVAGGALAATLAGAGIGAGAGGLLGALADMDVPEEEARHFETGFQRGDALVTVKAGNKVMQAMQILEHYGADTGPGGTHFRNFDSEGEGATAAGALGGGTTGAVIGTAVGGPVGTVAGAAIGGVAGAAAGKAADEASGPGDGHQGKEGAAGGALAGGAAGAAAGTAVAGPVGTIPGAIIGGTAGAATGGAIGEEIAEDDNDTLDERRRNR